MKNIKKAILAVTNVQMEEQILREFAAKKFRERFPAHINQHAWFNGYDIVDEDTIRVKYQYGGGDMEMDGHFDVKIIP